jgi:hypothetical protein
MAKVYIQFLAKNFSLDGPCVQIESDVIPRVGELIDAHEYLQKPRDLVGTYIVQSVIYKLTERGFVPYVTAHS